MQFINLIYKVVPSGYGTKWSLAHCTKLYRGPERDSQGGEQPPGTSPRDEGTMIDDDFKRIVDQLFGRMMSDMLRMSPFSSLDAESDDHDEGSDEQRFESEIDSNEDHGEMIDLGDSILIAVDGVSDAARPRAVIKNRQLTVKIDGDNDRELKFDLPYNVSLKKSNTSVRNGVMEMHLPKTLNSEEEIGSKE